MVLLAGVIVAGRGTEQSGRGPGVVQVIPGPTWTIRSPIELGIDPAALDDFSRLIGGRGVVVRRGFLVYTWGDAARRGDIASAAKPIYGHFLFAAIARGLLTSLDDQVVDRVPELATLNPGLAHKDRDITFRHLATQTSGYGVTDPPGAAYDYNDWQMALFWDTLFLRVWRASYETVDASVLDRELCDVIQCEDDPTFLAFGAADRPGRVAISPRDLARFALLYLRGGRWGDRLVLPGPVVRQILQSPLPNAIPRTAGIAASMLPGQRSIGSRVVPDDQTDHLGSYSFMWWVNGVDRQGRRLLPDAPPDTVVASGHGSRRAAVLVPSLDLIATWNDTNLNGWPSTNLALRTLLSGVR
jgi:CubicO group peptidase (beta-lactamase class C family)